MPFDDDYQDLEENKTGTKLSNKNSIFANKPKKPDPRQSEQKAQESINRSVNYNQRAGELASSFKKILEDKTLPQNKNILTADIEKDILSKLSELAMDINTDENEPEGYGSVSLIILLFRSVLIQRDRLNELDYNNNLLKKQIKELEAKLNLPK